VTIRFVGVGSDSSPITAPSSSRSIPFLFFVDEGPTTVETEAATEGDLVLSTRVSFEACEELERLRLCVGVVDEDDSACDVDEEASAESLVLIV